MLCIKIYALNTFMRRLFQKEKILILWSDLTCQSIAVSWVSSIGYNREPGFASPTITQDARQRKLVPQLQM